MLVAGVQWGISRTLPVAVQCACVKGKVEIEGGIAAASLSLSLCIDCQRKSSGRKMGKMGQKRGKEWGKST